MNYFLLTLCSNTKDCAILMSKASDEIKNISDNSIFSSVYSTIAEGKGYSGTYLNCVALIYTNKEILFWEDYFKELEIRDGRDENCRKNKIVPIDADITIWNNDIIRSGNLKMNYIKKGIEELKTTDCQIPYFLFCAK